MAGRAPKTRRPTGSQSVNPLVPRGTKAIVQAAPLAIHAADARQHFVFVYPVNDASRTTGRRRAVLRLCLHEGQHFRWNSDQSGAQYIRLAPKIEHMLY